MSKKAYSNKTTVKKKPTKAKTKKVKPRGGGPNRNPCPKNGMGPRKLRA